MFYSICSVDMFVETELNNVFELLSKEQKAYIGSLNEEKRNQSLAARALLMKIASEHFDEFSLEYFCTYENGKPYLQNSSCEVSLTHSGEFVGCAVSDTVVGMDIQCYSEVSEKLIKRVCTSEEQSYMALNGDKYFYLFWSLKESCKKAFDITFSQMAKLSFVEDGQIISPSKDFKIEYGLTDFYAWSICY